MDKEKYTIKIGRGYYGEEIDNITFDGVEEVAAAVEKMLRATSDKEKILLTLEVEYGYILSSIVNITAVRIELINLALIVVGQPDHYKRLEKDIVDSYKSKFSDEQPKIVVLAEDENRYRLIDGYHRLAAHTKDIATIKAVVLS